MSEIRRPKQMKEKDLLIFSMKTLDYCPETGVFVHLKRTPDMFSTLRDCNKWNTRYAGKAAGRLKKNKNGKSYRYVSLSNVSYLSHRIAWLMCFGELPDCIDHINGDGGDNRLKNLRNVSISENSRNLKLFKNNISGIPGVTLQPQCKSLRWTVNIQLDRVCHYLGIYDDFLTACAIRKSAENKFKFHKNHGGVRPL